MRLASSGGRRLRHAAVAAGRLALYQEPGVTRKELSAVCRTATEALELRPSVRLVLSELVANWGEQVWERLLVWPSNDHLVRRTGLSERAIRDALRTLIDLGLLAPKDSPNGKRYAIRNRDGTVIDAYGFDLTPLYARREDWTARVADLKAHRAHVRHTFDALTVARRGAEETIHALHETYPDATREPLETRYAALVSCTPRRSAKMPPDDLLDAWTTLRATAEDLYVLAGSDGGICRHNESQIESSGEACNNATARPAQASTHPAETLDRSVNHPTSEQPSDDDILKAMEEGGRTAPRQHQPAAMRPETLPAIIREACPAALTYGRNVETLPDVVAFGRFLRPMLGASETVWTEAEASIGPVRAATAVIYILQLYEDDANRNGGESRIRNPGGYLRAFVRMVASGQVDLSSDLLAMRRRRTTPASGPHLAGRPKGLVSRPCSSPDMNILIDNEDADGGADGIATTARIAGAIGHRHIRRFAPPSPQC